MFAAMHSRSVRTERLIRRILGGAALALALSASAPAAAATVDLAAGHAVALRGVAFEGRRYDVTFSAASFESVLGATDDPFPFVGRAFASLSPLLDAVTWALGASGATALGDPATGLAFSRGVLPTRAESVLDADDFVGVDIGRSGPGWSVFGGVALDRAAPVGASNRALMVFEEVAPVPLPGAGLLLAAALAALGLRRRRAA